eukprot:401429-Prymnesium_polylepis.1
MKSSCGRQSSKDVSRRGRHKLGTCTPWLSSPSWRCCYCGKSAPAGCLNASRRAISPHALVAAVRLREVAASGRAH